MYDVALHVGYRGTHHVAAAPSGASGALPEDFPSLDRRNGRIVVPRNLVPPGPSMREGLGVGIGKGRARRAIRTALQAESLVGPSRKMGYRTPSRRRAERHYAPGIFGIVLAAGAIAGLGACTRNDSSLPPTVTARADAPVAATFDVADAGAPAIVVDSANPPPEAPGIFQGRVIAGVMGAAGADWLERADRASTEQPDRVLEAIGVVPGMLVADVGAGTGFMTLRLARRVGPQGKVYATDIQEAMLSRLRENVARAHLANVVPVLATETSTGLAAASVDLELLVDVYHELARPAETLRQLRAALHPGGRLVLVEYRADDPNVGIKPEHTMTLAKIRSEVESSGFRFRKVHEFMPKQRVVEFE